ncbi:MAG: outer membrane protein assembly factor BamB family protein [Burkholderiaceae bacterium]
MTANIAPTAVSLSARTTASAPSAMVQLSLSSAVSGLHVTVKDGARGYVTASATDVSGGASIRITGASPGSLAAGTYQDTVAVTVCYDSCSKQSANSPLSIPVTYKVTASDASSATPTLDSLTPSTVVAGSGAMTLVLAGSDFAQGSQVLWNGSARPTTFVSATSISAQLTAADVATVSQAWVTVTNASTGGGVSNVVKLPITAMTPSVSTVTPSAIGVGGSPFTLTVVGAGFDATAKVTWNGSARTTTYVSPNQLTAQITAADIATRGSYPVGVYNADGATTTPANTLPVNVVDSALSLSSMSPVAVTAGSPAFVATLIGTGFAPTSTVQWNGAARTTTYVSSTQLQAQVTAADIATAGTASVTVANTSGSPLVSAALTVAINAASLQATAIQLNALHNGVMNFRNIVPASAFPLASSWSTTLAGRVSYPLIVNDRVFVTVQLTNTTSELVALNATTGATLWGPVALSGVSHATYDSGKLLVQSTQSSGLRGLVTAYDPASGTQLWSSTINTEYFFDVPPTAANGMMYTAGTGDSGFVYALDANTGALVWSAGVLNGDDSSPTVTADGVYVSYVCNTYDLNPLTGARNWTNDTGCEGGGGGTGTMANGTYYSPNAGSRYDGMTFDPETGAAGPSYTADAQPVIGAQYGYFIQNGVLKALSLADNSVQWSLTADSAFDGAPLLVNGYLFVPGSNGRLYAVDAATGAQLWETSQGIVIDHNAYMPVWGMAAGEGKLVVPAGNTLTVYTLSTNP